MFKVLVEQWKANQEHKRTIAAERWEQEKRWREEDRQESKAREAAEQERKAEEEARTAEEKAHADETYRIIYRAHLDVLRTAATISYVGRTGHSAAEASGGFAARQRACPAPAPKAAPCLPIAHGRAVAAAYPFLTVPEPPAGTAPLAGGKC
jgi:membrane protein involved in colicin uptake